MEHTSAMQMPRAKIQSEVTSVRAMSQVFMAMGASVTITIRVGMSHATSMPRVSRMRMKRRITSAHVKVNRLKNYCN